MSLKDHVYYKKRNLDFKGCSSWLAAKDYFDMHCSTDMLVHSTAFVIAFVELEIAHWVQYSANTELFPTPVIDPLFVFCHYK